MYIFECASVSTIAKNSEIELQKYDTIAYHEFHKLAETTPRAGVAYFTFIEYMDVEDDDLLPKPWFEKLYLDGDSERRTS
ncbi:hypothetical protein BC936DRAFT_142332 [Jimgerdemannia flammicorona]|uniref:Uncharacterized protein n=1 Tax=Jimgerdemannia flammicorona TaxID=994334 RepID=A0A433DFB7_9FUNG|nr:hypothetical protein BC936DRAFT_142332 [Jimgerdemannia flammicorona]